MVSPDFFTAWVAEVDALPLVLTGGKAALEQETAHLTALFPATDVIQAAPTGRTISIETIRALRAAAGQRAWSGNRLIIIAQAETLSAAAGQALLKILEEPTRTSRFVLTTSWYRRLPLTIRSRCIRVRLSMKAPPPGKAEPRGLPAGVIARLASYAGDTPLSADTLDQITRSLAQALRHTGPNPALKTAYMRLRDYHRIAAEPGGNHKLARDVLLASLPVER